VLWAFGHRVVGSQWCVHRRFARQKEKFKDVKSENDEPGTA
jgi:hypothetical protein